MDRVICDVKEEVLRENKDGSRVVKRSYFYHEDLVLCGECVKNKTNMCPIRDNIRNVFIEDNFCSFGARR